MNNEFKQVGVGVGVGVMVLDSGKVLMSLRENCRHGNGVWGLPGGNVEFGETLEQAAIREIKEETGLDICEPEVICLMNRHDYGCHYITIGIVAKKWSGKLQNLEPHKHGDWQWLDLNDLPGNLYLPSKNIIDNYKTGTWYRG